MPERFPGSGVSLTLAVRGVTLAHDENVGRSGLRWGLPERYRSRSEAGGGFADTPLGFRSGGCQWTVNRTVETERQLLFGHQRIATATIRRSTGASDSDLAMTGPLKRTLRITAGGSSYGLSVVKSGPASTPA